MRLVLVTLLAIGLAQAVPGVPRTSKPIRIARAAAAIKRIEGVYKTRFVNSTVREEKFLSEDVLEIVPYAADKIYFRLHLEFFNGHTCDLFGIATYEDGSFVFHGPAGVSDEPCKLAISIAGRRIKLNDIGGNCRQYSCGVRGGYSGAGFPLTSRREIRYLKLIEASREFAEAIAEFKGFLKGTPDKH
ncbi:MAG: hypothetical protein QOC81_231 [Thermoanaerobaculia bacterium]|jgi:hypothetical protein|nr:hypothetical protein [Thermoanaerobaculia bacterium]